MRESPFDFPLSSRHALLAPVSQKRKLAAATRQRGNGNRKETTRGLARDMRDLCSQGSNRVQTKLLKACRQKLRQPSPQS